MTHRDQPHIPIEDEVDPGMTDPLGRLLARVKPVDPPGEFVDDVMRAVRADRPGLARRLWEFWPGGRVVLPYAYAAAAGAAVCFLAIQALTGGSVLDPAAGHRDLSGTLAPPGSSIIESVALESQAGRGLASVRSIEGGAALDVALTPAAPAEIRVAFEPGEAVFMGISGPGGVVDRLVVEDGSIRWTQLKPGPVTVLLAAQGPDGTTLEIGIGGQRGGSLHLPGRR